MMCNMHDVSLQWDYSEASNHITLREKPSLCVSLPVGKTAYSGSPIVVEDCSTASTNQKWVFSPNPEGSKRGAFKLKDTGFCLSVPEARMFQPGAQATLDDCIVGAHKLHLWSIPA